MIISAIAAIGENRELGKDNKLLWRIPEDLKRFKQLTLGHPVIMGRKTYESIGRPLPGRTNIIITRNSAYQAAGCIVVDSIEKAIIEAKKVENNEIFIIGGGEVYKSALQYADKLYLTIVHASAAADVYFPDYSTFAKITNRTEVESQGHRLTFLELEKDQWS